MLAEARSVSRVGSSSRSRSRHGGLMDREVASGQLAAGFISIQRGNVDVERIRLVGVFQRGDLDGEGHLPSVVENADAAQQGLITFDHQQVEFLDLEPQVGFVILIGQVALWLCITFVILNGEAEGDPNTILV